jgi:hypothetical protein
MSIHAAESAIAVAVKINTKIETMSELLYMKKGDFKSGFLSKVTAGEFRFYEDRIVFQPGGWNRLFNSAPIIIDGRTIMGFNESFTIIGYSLAVITTQGKYTFRFIGDKLEVYQLMERYVKQK